MSNSKQNRYHQLERMIRGVANHRRIEILELLSMNPNLSVVKICWKISINMKTGSEHIRRLNIAGLVWKHSVGSAVHHTLTTRGKSILKFLRTLE